MVDANKAWVEDMHKEWYGHAKSSINDSIMSLQRELDGLRNTPKRFQMFHHDHDIAIISGKISGLRLAIQLIDPKEINVIEQ